MRITESQLRRIVRQEVRRLTESHTPESVAQEALDLYDTAPKGVGYPGESAFRLINQRSREGVDREASLAAIAAMDPEAAKDIKNAMRMSSHLDTMGVYPAGRYGGD